MSKYGWEQDLKDADYFERIILKWLNHYHPRYAWDKKQGKFKPYDIFSTVTQKPTIEVKFSRALYNLVFEHPCIKDTQSDIWIHGLKDYHQEFFKSEVFAFTTNKLRDWVFEQHRKGLIKSAKPAGDFNTVMYSIPMVELREQPFCTTFNLRTDFKLLEWAEKTA